LRDGHAFAGSIAYIAPRHEHSERIVIIFYKTYNSKALQLYSLLNEITFFLENRVFLKKKIMAYTEKILVPLYEKFIRDMKSGKRLNKRGGKIRTGTIDNYGYTLKYLRLYEDIYEKQLRIRIATKLSLKERVVEKRYWQKFYLDFTALAYKNGCFDNYVGRLVKNLKVFFRYLQDELCLDIGNFFTDFQVVSEDVDIIIVEPERLKRLIYDTEFEASLSPTLQHVKDLFVIGCTVALRYGDLSKLKWSQIIQLNGNQYLVTRSEKTDTTSRIKLPVYAINILEKYRSHKIKRGQIFPYTSMAWFDKCIKRLIEQAGWTEEVGKMRKVRGISRQIKREGGKVFRFCDLATSHLMRRTAITTMLMNGVPESVIKQVSGHSGDSKSFVRYVKLVQPYMDQHIDRHFDLMQVRRLFV
jgi:hypothetical protein